MSERTVMTVVQLYGDPRPRWVTVDAPPVDAQELGDELEQDGNNGAAGGKKKRLSLSLQMMFSIPHSPLAMRDN